MHNFFEELPQYSLLLLAHNSIDWTKLYRSLEVQVLASHPPTSAGDLLQMNMKYILPPPPPRPLLRKQRAQL